MAVLAHPTLGTGGAAPTANAELIPLTAFSVPPTIVLPGTRTPHPDPANLTSGSGGGDSAVGYAS